MAAKYLDIAAEIRRQIAAGEWPAGSKLPTLVELARQFAADKNTIHRAIGVLEADGLVTATQGSGIVVRYGESAAGADEAAVVRFAFEVGQLKRTPRAGWQLAGIRQPESVAEHSFRTAVLAYIIATLEGADADKAAAIALFHDVPEARTTDLHSVAKPHVDIEHDNEVIYTQTAGLPDSLVAPVRALIAEFASKATPEARCAKDADKLECLLQAREYEAQGNPLVKPWVDSMVAAVVTPSAKRLAEAAVTVSPDAWWHDIVASYGR